MFFGDSAREGRAGGSWNLSIGWITLCNPCVRGRVIPSYHSLVPSLCKDCCSNCFGYIAPPPPRPLPPKTPKSVVPQCTFPLNSCRRVSRKQPVRIEIVFVFVLFQLCKPRFIHTLSSAANRCQAEIPVESPCVIFCVRLDHPVKSSCPLDHPV